MWAAVVIEVGEVEFGFQVVAAAFAAGEAGGEDHAVVSQCGVRDAVVSTGFAEFGPEDGAGDAGVGGDGEGIGAWSSSQVRISTWVVSASHQWVKSACQRSLGCSAAKRM